MRGIYYVLATTVVGLGFAAPSAALGQPARSTPEITASVISNVARVSGDGLTPDEQTGSERVATEQSGHERDVCGTGVASDPVRSAKSNAAASASADVRPSGNSVYLVTLDATAAAQGGVDTTCPGCAPPCTPTAISKTGAAATAKAHLQLTMAFPQSVADDFFTLSVSGTGNIGANNPFLYEVSLDKTQLGAGLAPDPTDFDFFAPAGSILTIVMDLSEDASSKTTVLDRRSSEVQVKIEVKRAVRGAALQSSDFRIIGGRETSLYPAVGAILLRGEFLCTGTLIGARTVLTAAHCIDAQQVPEARQLQFALGDSVTDAAHPPRIIPVYNTVPHEGFNRDAKLHDIGVVILSESVTDVEFPTLYAGTPELLAYCRNTDPLFVGFGLADLSNRSGTIGRKRLTRLPVRQVVKNRREFVNSVIPREDGPPINTCLGDSGAPAFIQVPGESELLAGIVSRGDKTCVTNGVNVSVDEYLKWIATHKW